MIGAFLWAEKMKTRRLIDNDYSFGNGRADILEGAAAILQTCQVKLMQLAGEWFLDARDGVDWGSVLGHKPDIGVLTSLIKRTLISIDGVEEVKTLDVTIDDRNVYIVSKIKTKTADIQFNKSLNALEILANDEIN